MRLPWLLASILLSPALVLVVATTPTSASVPRIAAAFAHDVAVSGDDVAFYPAFDRGTSRYAMTTGPATDGTVTVTATTSDPASVVTVNGRPAPSGIQTVTGLEPGDEVAVLIDDADEHVAYSFVYLPEEFPTLERVTPALGVPTHEHVMLTLGLWLAPSPFFETAVDANGVPARLMTNRSGSSMDLKRQPNGHFSVQRGNGNPAFPNSEVVEYDEQWREVGRHRALGLAHTDGHDSMLLPDGSRYFMSYEPDPATGRLDAVIQHVSASDQVLFTWNSRDHVTETETVSGSNPDYAHINSFQIMQDGDLLVSFRHFSSVFKIARTSHDGYEEGAVVWKLGGRASSFDFETVDGAPDIGPCAQHTATELPNGNILVFDNGSWAAATKLCVDPDDKEGQPVEHLPSRIAEWELGEDDPDNKVATLVRDHTVNGRHAIFAGSAQPLSDGGAMVGWASNTEAVASELDSDGDVTWELRDSEPTRSERYFTYRAFALDLPDEIKPVVSVPPLPGGGVYVEGQRVRSSYSCTDLGGSSLQSCSASPVDTRTPGVRTLTVRATDGDGNVTTIARRYRVEHRYRPDAAIRARGTTRFVGPDRYGARPAQQVTMTSRGARRPLVAVVRVHNAGGSPDRFTVRQRARSRYFVARLVGARTSPLLRPGQSWTVRVRVSPRPSADRGDQVGVRVVATSRHNPTRHDTVWLRARRR